MHIALRIVGHLKWVISLPYYAKMLGTRTKKTPASDVLFSRFLPPPPTTLSVHLCLSVHSKTT